MQKSLTVAGLLLAVFCLQSCASREHTRLIAKSKDIVHGKIEIGFRKSRQFRIEVRPEMLPASLSIDFRVEGAVPLSDNDVEVGIGDSMNIANFENGHYASLLWSTPGPMTTDKAEVTFLNVGEYFLTSQQSSLVDPQERDAYGDSQLPSAREVH